MYGGSPIQVRPPVQRLGGWCSVDAGRVLRGCAVVASHGTEFTTGASGPPGWTSKCRCGPVEWPEEPTCPIC